MIVIIAYDIPSTKRRTRLHKALKGYGVNAQRSVFECDVSPEQMKGLLTMLEFMIDPGEDDLRIYPLCKGCQDKVKSLGVGDFNRSEEIIII
ncbi:CRISPR-associated endonuclease Cas2 [Desulfurispira natronophila]|uniref:CRISPR-associated endoribonuclease Cas2 n=1 Tax=Desulfurispira natronophila TaxID=682562 RepID=A0A7W7Y538_9BACT|nr:CRISPR-associated endonuclease Cas2 [Desulfurispira natronophila]MBB5022258.1 CRISPR-associated protein Cas2 [Desulfurispira natronophila]